MNSPLLNLTINSVLERVLAQYQLPLEQCQITPLGNGLINTTILVKSPSRSMVLQRINQEVFTSPKHVIGNADLISQHLQEKHNNDEYSLKPIWQHPNVINQTHTIVDGEYWRALEYIDNSYTLKTVEDASQATALAQAFAHFSSALSDFDSRELSTIIPNFHHLPSRINELENSMKHATKAKLEQSEALITFIFSQQKFIDEITEVIEQVPLRVTHNDTKINNLLFSEASKCPIAVIDLDTCMSGYLMHDFGDMVRSCCAKTAEDEPRLENITIDFDIVRALAQGYLGGFSFPLSNTEKHSLITGVKLMPFMLSVRFLSDYLNNDKYFQIDYPEHNLVRAKNQLHLYQLFCQQSHLLSQAILS